MKRKLLTIGVAWLSVLFVVGGSRPESCGIESKMAKYELELVSGAVDMVRNREAVKEAFEEELRKAEAAGENAAGADFSGEPGPENNAEEVNPEEMSPEEKAAEERTDAYFDNSVFVGDSIMLGFRNYAMKRQDSFLSRLQFLAAGSYSVNNALWEVNEKSVHPMFRGKQRQVWESISMMGGRRVFLMLGMNDLNINGLEGSCEKYKELVDKIRQTDPGAEIHIMSMTYVLKGKGTGLLENDTIREYNSMLKQMAEENGWGYVDIADALADENGDLAEGYCSDGFAHQRPEAYDIWVSVLRAYAREQMEKTDTEDLVESENCIIQGTVQTNEK